MIHTDFTINLATWGLSLEKARAQVAADNIANANSSGVTKELDFQNLLNSLSKAFESGNMSQAYDIMKLPIASRSISNQSSNPTSLDVQVADLSSAQGRYKVIAEALTRKFGLMTIAVKGK